MKRLRTCWKVYKLLRANERWNVGVATRAEVDQRMTDPTGSVNRTAVDPAQLNQARKTLASLSAKVSRPAPAEAIRQSAQSKTRLKNKRSREADG